MHKKLVTFGCAVVEICERTDRQTDIYTDEQTDTLRTIREVISMRLSKETST